MNPLGDIGAKAIASGLKENNTLTTLDISNDCCYNYAVEPDLGDDGVKELASLVTTSKSLTTLVIGKIKSH